MQFLIALVLMVASTLISSLLIKKQKVKPASLEEFEFPQADEGLPQPVLFGQCWTKGWQVLWYGELATKKIKKGGKGK
jgi:hypothetical protein